MSQRTAAIVAPTLLALSLIAAPVAAAPGEMNVATFLSKVEALQAKGMMAMLSPDVSLLKQTVQNAGTAYKARLAQEKAAGHPSSCPPTPASFNSNQLIAHLKSYPAPDRGRLGMNAAISDFFRKTWPCR